MKTLTLKQAKNLKRGDILYHILHKNSDGSPQRWRVNGKVKTWKTDPSRVSVPVKHGLRHFDYLTEHGLSFVTLVPYERYYVSKFLCLSDSKSFQRKMRKEGYHTKIERMGMGTASPYYYVHYWM